MTIIARRWNKDTGGLEYVLMCGGNPGLSGREIGSRTLIDEKGNQHLFQLVRGFCETEGSYRGIVSFVDKDDLFNVGDTFITGKEEWRVDLPQSGIISVEATISSIYHRALVLGIGDPVLCKNIMKINIDGSVQIRLCKSMEIEKEFEYATHIDVQRAKELLDQTVEFQTNKSTGASISFGLGCSLRLSFENGEVIAAPGSLHWDDDHRRKSLNELYFDIFNEIDQSVGMSFQHEVTPIGRNDRARRLQKEIVKELMVKRPDLIRKK